jgi:hypothetical protein
MYRSAHKLGIEEGERKDHANRSFAALLARRYAATIDPACDDLPKPKLVCGDGSKQMQNLVRARDPETSTGTIVSRRRLCGCDTIHGRAP